MSSDPGNGGGDPGGNDPSERKTRFVPRNDLVERSPRPATEDTGLPAPGTVIGRTRLIGSHGQMAQAGGGAESSSPAMNMTSAKTQLIRGEGTETEPVAGWVVVVNGPGRGGF